MAKTRAGKIVRRVLFWTFTKTAKKPAQQAKAKPKPPTAKPSRTA